MSETPPGNDSNNTRSTGLESAVAAKAANLIVQEIEAMPIPGSDLVDSGGGDADKNELNENQSHENRLHQDAADLVIAHLNLCEGDPAAERAALAGIPRETIDQAQAFLLAATADPNRDPESVYTYDILTRVNESVLDRPRVDDRGKRGLM
jgi:hypothetical protein